LAQFDSLSVSIGLYRPVGELGTAVAAGVGVATGETGVATGETGAGTGVAVGAGAAATAAGLGGALVGGGLVGTGVSVGAGVLVGTGVSVGGGVLVAAGVLVAGGTGVAVGGSGVTVNVGSAVRVGRGGATLASCELAAQASEAKTRQANGSHPLKNFLVERCIIFGGISNRLQLNLVSYFCGAYSNTNTNRRQCRGVFVGWGGVANRAG